MNVRASWDGMLRVVRNLGRVGMCAMAVSAVDVRCGISRRACWASHWCPCWAQPGIPVPVYGSGGFTTYTDEQLAEQTAGWVEQGLGAVKIKVGSEPERDVARVHAVRLAIGPQSGLMVDANGAYSRKQALEMAERFATWGVTWFEEPVSSDDLQGLRLVRDRAPAGMAVAAGEYGYDLAGFRRLVDAGAVDVLQADATRCGGITGFLAAAALCEAHCLPMSAHTAPAQHAHPCCAAGPVESVEYFHDHVRIESELFDGLPELRDGRLTPDLSRPGNGLELRAAAL